MTKCIQNRHFSLDNALKFLDFAIQFTPQYGDSFLEVMRACSLIKAAEPSKAGQMDELVLKTRRNCLHAEPNYGVLWFYFKDTLLDNANDIWENAATPAKD